MSNRVTQDKIRNIAIIAHVDHGKTTLVDAFLKQSHVFRENQEEMQQDLIMDSGDLEKEKGITIKAKNASIHHGDYKINIIDTPGHADFGGEVERTLNMAEGCLLLVDAQEGPMPQTKFVLKKALELGLKPILVINKIDKKFANTPKVLDRVYDLFLQLATESHQLEFPVFYAIARDGKAFAELPDADGMNKPGDLIPLLDKIVEHVPAPVGDDTEPLQMQITSLEYDQHQGRYLIGKINRGTMKVDDSVVVVHNQEEGAQRDTGRIKRILIREGLEFVDVKQASAGEIVAVTGVDSSAIGATLCISSKVEPLPVIKISSPSVKIRFEANTSPLVGKDGQFVTMKMIEQRLLKEKEINISLEISKADGGAYYVAGRGELQLAILIETMRREGYEFQVRKPEVIFKEIDGVKMEPMEELFIEVPEAYLGTINSALSQRSAELINIENENGSSRFNYKILTRNLLGLRSQLLTATKGNLVINNFFLEYVPFTQQAELFRKGVLISSDPGMAMGYALNTIQERGELFIEPGTEVYEGMIIGINKYEQDLEVNPTKQRHKSGVRMSQAEITQTKLKSLIQLTLEFALFFINEDEMLEVTPNYLRLRKVALSKTDREKAGRIKKNAQG